MKAMVFAAGLGTRLKPMTGNRPKALVEVAGQTMLEMTLSRLRSFGIQDVIVNVHHFADSVVEYLKAHDDFGMHVEVSREDELLDTGGGLMKASEFLEDSDPFIVHNVDVISTIDLGRMVQFHKGHAALASLAVMDRQTSRHLLFDEHLQLCGRNTELVRPAAHPKPLAFSGIHVISPRIFPSIRQRGVFSIIDAYLDLAARSERIMAFRTDEYYWHDLGRPENVRQALQDRARWRDA